MQFQENPYTSGLKRVFRTQRVGPGFVGLFAAGLGLGI